MTIPVWPDELPQRVLRDGYNEKSSDGRLFTRMSAGPPKTRRKYSLAVKTVQAAILIDYDQKARLERFMTEETLDCTVPFLIPDQTHDGVPLSDEDGLILLDEVGNQLVDSANWLVIFAENAIPDFSPYGVMFRSSFTLLVLP